MHLMDEACGRHTRHDSSKRAAQLLTQNSAQLPRGPQDAVSARILIDVCGRRAEVVVVRRWRRAGAERR